MRCIVLYRVTCPQIDPRREESRCSVGIGHGLYAVASALIRPLLQQTQVYRKMQSSRRRAIQMQMQMQMQVQKNTRYVAPPIPKNNPFLQRVPVIAPARNSSISRKWSGDIFVFPALTGLTGWQVTLPPQIHYKTCVAGPQRDTSRPFAFCSRRTNRTTYSKLRSRESLFQSFRDHRHDGVQEYKNEGAQATSSRLFEAVSRHVSSHLATPARQCRALFIIRAGSPGVGEQ